jgi:hypothetical protein
MIRRPLLATLTATFLLIGCATTEPAGGRFLQLYKQGFLTSEFDMISNHGCREGVREMLKKFEESKVSDGSATCGSTSAKDSLPVVVSVAHTDEPRATKYRMASMTQCKSAAEEGMKKDPKLTVTCEAEQK